MPQTLYQIDETTPHELKITIAPALKRKHFINRRIIPFCLLFISFMINMVILKANLSPIALIVPSLVLIMALLLFFKDIPSFLHLEKDKISIIYQNFKRQKVKQYFRPEFNKIFYRCDSTKAKQITITLELNSQKAITLLEANFTTENQTEMKGLFQLLSRWI